MNDSSIGGFLGIVLIIIRIIIWIGMGRIAWNWVETENFRGGLVFLIAWGILAYITQAIVGFIFVAIAGMFSE